MGIPLPFLSLLAALPLLGASAPPCSTTATATFTLDAPSAAAAAGEDIVAFAGVFDASGRLLRQVFAPRGEGGALHPRVPTDGASPPSAQFAWAPSSFPAGARLRAFAGAAPSYEWAGIVANNGQNEGFFVWQGLNAVEDMAISGDVGAVVEGYAELDFAMKLVNMSDTSGEAPIMHSDYHRYFTLAATDGETAYFANAGLLTPPSSFFYIPTTFVVGYDYGSGCDHNFTLGGRTECEVGTGQGNCTPSWDGCHSGGSYWASVIDFAHTPNETNADGTAFPDSVTGLAVQRNPGGRALAVAHGWRAADNVRLFDKASGASLCNYTLDSPRSLAFSALSGDLWAVDASGVGRYAIPASCDGSPLQRLALLGPEAVAAPGAIAVGPFSDRLFAVDTASQQVRVFNGSTGAPLAPLGRAGGYSDGNVTVGADKFWLLPTPRGGFVAVDDDEAEGVWVNDFGNRRILHVDSRTGAALSAQIAYVGVCYKSVVHPAQPSRLFVNYLEFEVDYGGASITPDSWRLVRNWAAGLPPQFSPLNYESAQAGDGFAWSGIQMIGFAQNTTLALLNYYPFAPANDSSRRVVGAILGDDGALHMLQNWSVGGGGADDCWAGFVGSFSLEADGAMRYAHHFVEGDAAWVSIYEAPFSLNGSSGGAAGAPGWNLSCAYAGPVGDVIATWNVTVNATTAFMPRAGGVALHLPITASGAIILLDGSRTENAGAHLGAIQRGASGAEGLLWTASQWGNWTLNETDQLVNGYNLSLYHVGPQDGSFGAANPGTNYAAGFPVTAERDLIFPFFGEGWMGWEANQFLHFADNGLFIGQFGTPNFPTSGAGTQLHYVLPGAAGNAFSPAFFIDPASGKAIFTHNDENQHGGIHVWNVYGGAMRKRRGGSGGVGAALAPEAGMTEMREERTSCAA